MLRVERPQRPAGFDKKAERLRKEVEESINNGATPKFKENWWKKYKAFFSEAQNCKCGYCDYGAVGPSHGDVEHYYPKGEVWELPVDPEKQGREVPHLAKVVGRNPETRCSPGYWWLAYEWENYLLACQICNEQWKLSFFPVEKPRELPPCKGVSENPLLLNPFTGPDPAEHLWFGPEGDVKALNKSAYGQATIDVCGLNRGTLRRPRRTIAKRAHELTREINDARKAGDYEALDRGLADVLEMGNAANDFACVVRAIFQQQCNTTWKELERLVQQPAAAGC